MTPASLSNLGTHCRVMQRRCPTCPRCCPGTTVAVESQFNSTVRIWCLSTQSLLNERPPLQTRLHFPLVTIHLHVVNLCNCAQDTINDNRFYPTCSTRPRAWPCHPSLTRGPRCTCSHVNSSTQEGDGFPTYINFVCQLWGWPINPYINLLCFNTKWETIQQNANSYYKQQYNTECCHGHGSKCGTTSPR